MDIWKILYPRCCPVCHEILDGKSPLIHPACMGKMQPVGEPRCKCCGKLLELKEEELCADCKKTHHHFTAGIGIFPYEKDAHVSMVKYKQEGRQEYERFYIKAAAFYGRDWVLRHRPQALIPVPSQDAEIRRRGFYPAGNLARGLSQAWQIPVADGLLRKVRKTRPQKELTYEKRRKNLQGAFEGRPGDWGLRRILLLDDVYTTGSTMDEAARVGAAHGVEEIYFLTIFVGNGY